jgi:hypothetical protein
VTGVNLKLSDQNQGIVNSLCPQNNDPHFDRVKATVCALLSYCQRNNWAGYDPYDALNSKFFESFSFLDFKLARLLFIQLLKRIPFNFRKTLLIPRTQNPKSLALFLSSFIKLSEMGLVDEILLMEMVSRIKALRAPNVSYWCWGYSFPWQTRSLIVPKWAPNLVCTVFVANSIVDAYEYKNQKDLLKIAVSAANYIVDELFWQKSETISSFRYPSPSSPSLVHNANFLAAAFLSRIYHHCGNDKYRKIAVEVAEYSASCQQSDGSWFYGEHPTQRWIDNFHTGYNLVALNTIIRDSNHDEFKTTLQKGIRFYIDNFFDDYCKPKYYSTQLYPIDIHCIAQSIVTLINFADHPLVKKEQILAIFDWSYKNFYDKDGYFYYQITPLYKSKIPYMRWSQAWMLYSLTLLLNYLKI